MSAQPSGGPSLWDLLQARLGQHARDVYAPMLGGGQPLPHRLGHAFEAGTHLGELGLIKDAAEHVVGDVVGSMYAASSGQSADPRDQRIAEAYRQGGPAASLAAARTDPRKEVSLTAGALTEMLNPVNYVGGPLGRLGRVGEIADVVGRAPFAPLEAALGGATRLGPRLGKVAPALAQGAIGAAIGSGVGDTPEEHARNALIGAGLGGTLGYKSAAAQIAARDASVLRARQALYGPVEGVAGNVPRSAGLIGPVPPPPLRAPPPLVPGSTSILDLARGGVPPAEVAKIAPLPEALAPTRAPNLVREALVGAPTPALHGPELPPVRALAPEQLREALGNLAARRMTSPPPEAVTLAQERALRPEVVSEPISAASVAPSPRVEATRGVPAGATPAATLGDTGYAAPAADRAAALAGFSGRDTNTLLNIAYDHPKAVANAQAKYPDVGALRARAIERIQLDAGRVRRLAATDPDLAARVEALPDVEVAGGVGEIGPNPPPPGGGLDAAQAAYEAAATPEAKLAAERQFVDAYQGAGVAAPAEQVAREGAAEGNRGQSLFQQMRKGDVPGAPLVSPLAAPLEAARVLGPDVARGADKVLEALTGVNAADLAASGPESLAYYRKVRQAEAAKIGTEAQAREAGLPAYVRGSKGPGEFVDDFIRHVRDQVVVTFKNQFLDKQHTRFMVGEYAPEASDVGGTFAQIAADKRADRAAPVADTVGTFLDGWMGTDASARYQQGLDLGEGLVGSLDEAGQALGAPRRELPAMQRRIFGVLTAALRTRGPVSAASIPVGALRGELAPLVNEFFRTVNRFPQRIGREVLFYLNAKANTLLASGHLLDRMASAGIDVAPLTGRPFTPADVEAVAGREWASAWSSALATTLGAAEAETKRVLGSFAEKTALEKIPGIGKVFWLMGWSQRMLPVYAQVAARHPGVAMAVGGATLEQARHLKEEGLPPWAAGGIDTAIGRVNLLSPMPFSGELAGEALSALGEGDPGEAKTPYQTAEGIAGGLGLPVNPIVGTAAYVAGLTPKRPGDFDRYAGPINALPGPTTGLDYGHLVDKAREIVAGLGAGDLAAGKKAPASETDKEWNRLVAERTGLVASDPRNIGAIIDVQTRDTDPDTLAARWYREAEENVKGRQGKQGVVSAISPLTISRIDPLQRAAAIGRQNQPYSYQQISAAYDAGNKKAARAMQAANTASKAPDQRVYDSASEAQRLGLVKGFLAQQQATRRGPISGDVYGLHNRPHGAGSP
jgi:hypothetical protein